MGLTIGDIEVATEDAVDEAVVLNHLVREVDPKEDVEMASSRMEEVAEVEAHEGVAEGMIEAVDREVVADDRTLMLNSG